MKFLLTNPAKPVCSYFNKRVQVLSRLIGNPVEIGDGPAAVSGDERRRKPLQPIRLWEGAASKGIHESEDLPGRTKAVFRGAKKRLA
jgi:hypothetical protein